MGAAESAGGRAGGYWDKVSGQRGNREKNRDYNESVDSQYGDTQGVLSTMKDNDTTYYDKTASQNRVYKSYRDQAVSKMNRRSDTIADEADQQSKDARATYTNTVQPRMKGIMEDAQRESDSAMTLQQASDPNNAVAQANRAMYDQQAQNVGRQALADSGVLMSLGAQATAQQLGGAAPMTGGQMASIQGANMSQSSQAFNAAQQRMQKLRDQGIERGYSETDKAYSRGQDAKSRYANSVKDFDTAEGIQQDRMARMRGERYGYSTDQFGRDMGVAQENYGMDRGLSGLQYGQAQNQNNLQLGAIGDYYGTEQQGIANAIQGSNAQTAGAMGTVGTIAGTVAGAYAGGGAGAAAGGQAGGQLGRSMAPQGSVPQANYGGGVQAAAGGYNYQPQNQGYGTYNYGYGPGGYPARPY